MPYFKLLNKKFAFDYAYVRVLMLALCLTSALDNIGQSTASFADSLWLELAPIPSNAEKLDSLYNITLAYTNLDLAKSLELASLGQSKSIDLGEETWENKFDFKLGVLYVNLAAYDTAVWFFDKVMVAARANGDQALLARGLQKMGSVKMNQGDFLKSMELNMESLRIYEELGDQAKVGFMLVNLSDVFFYLERYQEGVDYGLQAVKIFEEIDDKVELFYAYQAISINYLGTEEYNNALAYVDRAMNLAPVIGVGEVSMASLHNSRGNALKHLRRYDQAIAEYKNSNRIAAENNYPSGLSATLANISDVYMRKGEYENALPYQLESYEIMNQSGFHMNRMENISNLSTIYKEIGDYENALKYREQHQFLRDSVLSLEKDKITKELSSKYESEKKEELIALQEDKLFRQRIIQGLIAGVSVLLAVLLALLFRNFRHKQRNNELLESANLQLAAKNKENELLLKEIHHRVKNNLQTISSLLSLQSESISDPTALDAVQESRNRVRSMAMIHQKLYQRDNLAAIEMRDYFNTIGKAIIESFGEHGKQVSLQVDMSDLELDVDTAVPIGLITNELITNSLKYAFPKNRSGQISISLSQHKNDLLKLQITDNGEPGPENVNSSKTGGFGTLLIQLLTAQLGGQLERTTNEGTSTIITFARQEKSVA